MAQLNDFSKIIHNGNEISKVLHQGKTIWSGIFMPDTYSEVFDTTPSPAQRTVRLNKIPLGTYLVEFTNLKGFYQGFATVFGVRLNDKYSDPMRGTVNTTNRTTDDIVITDAHGWGTVNMGFTITFTKVG